MVSSNLKEQDIKNLKFRYLLWLYKTTKEEIDRVERKFTQLDIDKEIFQYILKHASPAQVGEKNKFNKLSKDFKEYIARKEKDGLNLKFTQGKLKPEYYFLLLKLQAIAKAIVKQFGRKAMDQIKTLYEAEMRRRILESKGHK
jgi:hypothetical protein